MAETHGRFRRRYAFRIAAYVVAGALINVCIVIALGFELLSLNLGMGGVMGVLPSRSREASPLLVSELRTFGSQSISISDSTMLTDDRERGDAMILAYLHSFENLQKSPPPGWALRSWADAGASIIQVRALGWPVKTATAWFGHSFRNGEPHGPPRSSGFTVFKLPWSGQWVSVPSRPHWPGAIVNTLFYGAIIGALHLLLFHARPTLRHRRGHCPKCAYDLRRDFQSGCPECGWNRPRAAPVTQPQRAGTSPGARRSSM